MRGDNIFNKLLRKLKPDHEHTKGVSKPSKFSYNFDSSPFTIHSKRVLSDEAVPAVEIINLFLFKSSDLFFCSKSVL